MYIPEINQLSFARLYSNHEPIKVLLNNILEKNIVDITIFNKDGTEHDRREIDITKNGFRFFDVDINSKYYYLILEVEENSYDAVDNHERNTFMCIDEAMTECENLKNKRSQHSDYEVVVRLNNGE